MNRIKVLAAMLSLCVGAASLPAAVFPLPEAAALVQKADRPASGTCGENMTWAFDETTGTLTVSGTGEMENFQDYASSPWNGLAVTSAVIGDGVTAIGAHAFYGCAALSSVAMPDSVTVIQYGAFENCSGLTAVTLPANLAQIASDAFSGCTALTSVTIPDGVAGIGTEAFSGCTALTSVTIPDSVGTIGNKAFSGCTSLSSVMLPETIADIGGATFSGTPWLAAKWEEAPVWIYGSYLADADKELQGECIIPDTVRVIQDDSFSGCSGLTSVTIPDSVIVIGECAFENCTGLTSVTLPATVHYVGIQAFEGSGLLSATVSAASIGPSGFRNCPFLTSITFADPDCDIYDSAETICNTYDMSSGTSTFTGTIFGYDDSTAQAYAEKYGYRFQSLGTAETLPDKGDVNGDGTLSIDDASDLLKCAAMQLFGDSHIADAQFQAADVNGDGALTVEDATILLRYLATKLFDNTAQLTDFI